MAKKREFASDSDVSRFISGKLKAAEKPVARAAEKEKTQVTIYPYKEDLEKVKIVAKVKDKNLNGMLLSLIKEAMEKEEYQKIIQAYEQMRKAMGEA